MLNHAGLQVPVTALCFYTEDVILSGEGNILRAYHVGTQDLLASVQVFESQAIHGIIVTSEASPRALVWGGRLIALLEYKIDPTGQYEFMLKACSVATDWILGAAFPPQLQDIGSDVVAFVTAHNALLVTTLGRLARKEESISTLEPIVPGFNCILYSAHITWLSASRCLIASGTAFGDIIVWSASIAASEGSSHAHAEMHYTFAAHEGSVFGVHISPRIEDGRLAGCERVLASCSDDRTVRLWDVSDLTTESPTLTKLQRETGFGTKTQSIQRAPLCLAKAMGHVSRIWKVRFHSQSSEHPLLGQTDMQIMSFGEDASNITWTLNETTSQATESLPYELEQVAIETAHAGKHIWSVAQSTSGLLVTGGADGAIAVRPASRSRRTAEIDRSLLGTGAAADNFKAYGFVDDGLLLSTTDHGKVVLLSFRASDPQIEAEVSGPLDGLRGYSVLASIPGYGFMSGSNGAVYMYSHEHRRLYGLINLGQKTAGIFPCSVDTVHDQKYIGLLVASVNGTSATLLRLQSYMKEDCNLLPVVQEQQQLELPHGFVVTSFTQIKYRDSMLSFLGSRLGSIAMYETSPNAASTGGVHSVLIPQAHGKEAVTVLNTRADSATCGFFLHSIGRDGTHAIHSLRLVDGTWEFELVHQLALPLGPNLEGLAFQPDQHLLLWGFRSKQFIIYDVSAQREIMAVECGGAHRNCAFTPTKNGGTFVWTKASRLYQHVQVEMPFQLINTGAHGREIKAVAVATTSPQLIATGAEDTDIKLSVLDGPLRFRCVHTLRKHNTGIQQLQWSSDNRYLFSSGGFEEFLIWRVRTGLPDCGVGVVCESRHPRSGSSDLRIMGFDVVEKDASAARLNITMAYSDSTVKQWQYSEGTWTLRAEGDYLTACLTNAVYGYHSLLVTTSTDGHLALWAQGNEHQDLHWIKRHALHQNAILAVTSCVLSDDSQLVITSGDDNAIVITRIANDQDVSSILLLRAHAAAVTGVVILHRHPGYLLVASASIDQRVKLWRINLDVRQRGVHGITVDPLAIRFTAVADVSSIAAYALEDSAFGVLVCGVGMEMWAVTMHERRLENAT